MGTENIIKVRGRLKPEWLPYGSRLPYLLPKDHKFGKLLIEHYHKSYCHAACNTPALIAVLRREY